MVINFSLSIITISLPYKLPYHGNYINKLLGQFKVLPPLNTEHAAAEERSCARQSACSLAWVQEMGLDM